MLIWLSYGMKTLPRLHPVKQVPNAPLLAVGQHAEAALIDGLHPHHGSTRSEKPDLNLKYKCDVVA